MPDNANGSSVALYWDFENIHAALCEERDPGSYSRPDNRFKPQDPLVEVQSIVDLAASFGPVAINRAYGNWQWLGRYRDQLLQNAVELIQMFPPGGAAKNGADIRLCLDAVEDIARFGHIGTVVVVGGDSDFMSVAQKIKAAGRTLIGVGTKGTTNRHWAKSCHEFRYYDSLVEPVRNPPPAPAAASAAPSGSGTPDAQDLLRRALRLLSEKKGEPWVNKGEVLPMMKRLDATFDLKASGYANFSAMVKALDAIVDVQKGTHDQQLRLK